MRLKGRQGASPRSRGQPDGGVTGYSVLGKRVVSFLDRVPVAMWSMVDAWSSVVILFCFAFSTHLLGFCSSATDPFFFFPSFCRRRVMSGSFASCSLMSWLRMIAFVVDRRECI